MHVKAASVREEEEEEEEKEEEEEEEGGKRSTEEGKKKCDSWGSVSGWWVQKGQDLELAVPFSAACLLSLGNANQTTCEPLPRLPTKKKFRKKVKKFVFILFFKSRYH